MLRKECKSDYASEQGIITRKINDGCYPSLNFPDNLEKRWVITRKSSWDSAWTDYEDKYTQSCDTPVVDFNTESVLVFYHGNGHGIKNVRSVTKDDGKKNIHYKITDYDCNKKRAVTKEYIVSYNMVVIPKIPDGYSVTFEISEGN